MSFGFRGMAPPTVRGCFRSNSAAMGRLTRRQLHDAARIRQHDEWIWLDRSHGQNVDDDWRQLLIGGAHAGSAHVGRLQGIDWAEVDAAILGVALATPYLPKQRPPRLLCLRSGLAASFRHSPGRRRVLLEDRLELRLECGQRLEPCGRIDQAWGSDLAWSLALDLVGNLIRLSARHRAAPPVIRPKSANPPKADSAALSPGYG